MLQNKNKSNSFYGTTLAVVLTALLFTSYPTKTQAALWPVMDPMITRMLDTVYDTIQGIIRGAAKQAAVKMLNSQLGNLVSGGGSGTAAFITDWTDYLITQPENNTQVYMNSYLAQMTSGRGSSAGYSSEGFYGGGNYATNLVQMEKTKIAQRSTTPTMTYEGDPSKMLDGGNFKSMSLYLSGINNPVAFDIATRNAYQQKLDDEKAVGQTRAIAYQGFKGTSSSSNPNAITYPGILTKEVVANVENMGNNVITSANSIPEIITSVVSQMIMKEINQGFSGVEKSLQKEASSQNRLDSGMNSAINTSGPGVLYNKN